MLPGSRPRLDREPGDLLLTEPLFQSRTLKESGEPQQVLEGPALLRAGQVWLPGAPRSQYRVRAAPDQPDQDLRDDRAAYRPETPAIAEKRRLGEDVVPERRALQERRIPWKLSLEYLALFVARRSFPDLLRAEHWNIAPPWQLLAERAGHRLACGHAQLVAAQKVPDSEVCGKSCLCLTLHSLQMLERLDDLRVDAARRVEEVAPLEEVLPLD